jgi:hypothetical protein
LNEIEEAHQVGVAVFTQVSLVDESPLEVPLTLLHSLF